MLAILLVVVSVLLGIMLMLRINFAESIIAKIAFGIPVGITVSSYIMLALYAANGMLTNTVFYATLALLTSFLALLTYIEGAKWRHRKRKVGATSANADTKRLASVSLWAGIVFAIIAFVLLSSLYMSNGSLYCIGPQMCSDLMYHIGIGNSLVYTHFPPKYFFSINSTNVFPFISDFYTAVLMKYGMSLRWAVLIPDLLLFFSAIFGSAVLVYRMTKNVFITVSTMFIFWFGSDYFMAIVLYSLGTFTNVVPNLLPPLSSFLNGYGVHSVNPIFAILDTSQFVVSGWTSIVYQMLLPQRDFVLGLPLGIMIIYAAYGIAFEKIKLGNTDLLLIGGVIGTLPLVHPVTLEVVAVVGIFAFLYMLRDKKNRKKTLTEFLIILAIILCLAIPQLLYMSHQRLASGWYKFVYQNFMPAQPGYFDAGLDVLLNVAVYWIEMVGVPLILAILGFFLAPKRLRVFFAPFLILWIFIMIYAVQPNPSDSNKIFVYVFLIISVFASYLLYWIYGKKSILAKFAAVVLIALVSLNFAFIYLYWAHFPLAWISRTAFNATNFILQNTNQNAIFAVSNNNSLLSIVPSLAHRQTLVSMGIYVSMDEYTYPLQMLNQTNAQIFDNGSCSAIKRFNISYIFYQESNASGERVFSNVNFTKIYNATDNIRGKHIAIYKVNC